MLGHDLLEARHVGIRHALQPHAELALASAQQALAERQFDAALREMRNALVADDRNKLEEMFRLSTQRRAAFDKKLP